MANTLRPQDRGWIYDVFLSFRGEDTRKNFTDHLYYALRDSGINVFRDDEELRRGEDISSELEQAIQGSKVAVIVFSQNYADSRWCLEELVKIMECRRTLRQLVLPIFYDVDPSIVRKQAGGFENAFLRHEERFFFDIDRVLRWRMALTEAANLSGWDLRNVADGHEAKFIRLIVDKISRELNSTYLYVALYPVGIESRTKVITSQLQIGLDHGVGVRMVGIWGMGGTGKSTIAKAVYNQLYHNFEGRCFLANVKEISKQPDGHVRLQEQLLCSISKSSKTKLESVDRGIALLQERFRRKKMLLILDDVDQIGQLNAIARSREWFGSGSRIIITTRDKHLLEQLQVDAICSVDEMNDTEALELFSWHAFRNSYPSEDFFKLSKCVVDYSGGLPLALEVLGSFLFGRSIPEWEDALNKLKTIPADQIQRKLRISFDGLIDRTYKDIFLDVSCFFIGMDRNYVEKVLDGCGFFPKIGISVLLQRCLLTIDRNKLMMHDLLRDMGREIVREKHPKELERHSRLLLHDEVLSVLTRQKGTDATEGLALKLPRFNKEKLSTEAFNEMQNLRLLQLNFVNLNGDFKHLSQELRWLCWHGFPLKFLPKDFHMEKLVALDLRYSHIRFFWKESKFLEKLKILNLSHSHDLTHTPDFSKLPSLEKLKLKDCKNLVELHPSVGELKGLVFINLKDCKRLKSLPESFSKLKSLETLVISGCLKINTLPEDLGELKSLLTLIADDTAIQKVPSTIVKLKNLKYLSLCGCKGPPSKSLPSLFWSLISPKKQHPNSIVLPASLQGLNSLRTLRLNNCNLSNNTIPKDIGSLVSLMELDLKDNAFHSLPSSIGGLSKLQTLSLDYCTELRCIPDLPPHLNSLYASNCTSLESTSDLSKAKHMATLSVSNCPKLAEITGLEKLLDSIRVIHMEGCSKISDSFKETILQGWTVVSGFGGVSLPSDEIPVWFAYKDEGNSVFFDMPQFSDCSLEGFIVCIVYSSCVDNKMSSDIGSLSVINYTKGVITTNNALTNELIMSTKDHLWQGHLSNKAFKMEAGDEVEIIVDFGAEITVKKIGISLVFDKYIGGKMLEFTSASMDDAVVANEDRDGTEDDGGVGTKRGCNDDDDVGQTAKRLKNEHDTSTEMKIDE